MMHLESEIKTLEVRQQEAFSFLSDFTNIHPPAERKEIKNWQASKEACSFEVDHGGRVDLHFVSKEPIKTLKTEGKARGIRFNLWIQLLTDNRGKTRMKLTIKADISEMMQLMARKPMEHFLTLLADNLTDMVNPLPGNSGNYSKNA